MPHNLYDRHDRIKAVEREYHAVRSSVYRMRRAIAVGVGGLAGAKIGDLITAEENLEGTYLSACGRSSRQGPFLLWLAHPRPGHPDRVARSHQRRGWRPSRPGRRRMCAGGPRNPGLPQHARACPRWPIRPITITDARHNLNTYLCKLPETWADGQTQRRRARTRGSLKLMQLAALIKDVPCCPALSPCCPACCPERSRGRVGRRGSWSVPPPGPGDDDIAQVERLAGLDGELLADRGFAAAEERREVLDAIGRARDQGGEDEPALGVGLEVASP